MDAISLNPTSWSTQAQVGGALTFALPIATVLFGRFVLKAKPSVIATAAALPACYTYTKMEVPKNFSKKTSPPPPKNPSKSPVSEKYEPQKGGGTLTVSSCSTVKFNDSSTVLELKIQDIVANTDVQAIVNAANKDLNLGGGVAGAIKVADSSGNVQKECNQIGGTPTGTAVLTSAGSIGAKELPLKHIIHAVGPIYNSSKHEESCRLLYEAYMASFNLAKEKGIRSLAIPFLSAEIFGFHADKGSSKIALRAVQDFVQNNPNALDLIRFVSLKATAPYTAFQNELELAYKKLN